MTFYTVHPADKDLNFLKKLNEDLKKKYINELEYLRLEPDYKSHERCLNTLRQNVNSTVFFFCHALEKSIRGCKIESAASSKSHKDFNYGNLISAANNIDTLTSKKVFALACFSSDLGELAIENGAKVYLGFGEIPFLVTPNYKEQQVINMVKENLRNIIYENIIHIIDNDLTFNDLSKRIIISIDVIRIKLLFNKDPGKNIRIEASKALSKIKNGIRIYGDGNLSLR